MANIVYHIENPDIPGVIVSEPLNGHVGVMFAEPVGFAGNAERGKQYHWECSICYLFPTSLQAREADRHCCCG